MPKKSVRRMLCVFSVSAAPPMILLRRSAHAVQLHYCLHGDETSATILEPKACGEIPKLQVHFVNGENLHLRGIVTEIELKQPHVADQQGRVVRLVGEDIADNAADLPGVFLADALPVKAE